MLDIEVQSSVTCFLYIFNLDAILLTCLHCNFLLCLLDTLTCLPQVDNSVTIDQQTQLIITTDSEDKVFVAGRDKSTIDASREILKVHTRSKDCITTITPFDWLSHSNSRDRHTAHVGIIIIDGLHTRIALWCLYLSETALNAFVAGQTTA